MLSRPVLHVIDTGGPGGAETVYLELLCGLRQRGWEPIAVVPTRNWLCGALEARDIEPVVLAGTRSFDVRFLTRLRALAARRRAGLIQTHLLGSAVYGGVVGRLLGLPQVSTFHGMVDVAPDEPYLRLKLKILDRSATRLVFVSRSLRTYFESLAGTGAAGLHVLHNGIDPELYQPGDETALRAELGVGPDDVLVGAIGNVRPAKDYANLLQAVGELSDRGCPVRCVVVGQADGSLAADLLALRDRLGLGQTVEFLGFRRDIPRILRALDVLAISSSTEGFSLSAVQALATGIPVVSTRCGGPEEILDHDTSGLLVPTGSPSALADGIARLIGDPVLRRRLSTAGRAIARSRFSLERMIDGYDLLYRELLTAEPGRA